MVTSGSGYGECHWGTYPGFPQMAWKTPSIRRTLWEKRESAGDTCLRWAVNGSPRSERPLQVCSLLGISLDPGIHRQVATQQRDGRLERDSHHSHWCIAAWIERHVWNI